MTGFAREHIQLRRHADTVLPGARPEHARGAMTIRILVTFEVALRQYYGGRLEQLREAGKNVAKQPGDAKRHVDARPAELRQWDDLETGETPGALVPARLDAGKLQGHRKFLAGRSHGRRSPEVDDQPLRPIAVILQVPAQQLFGKLDALGMGGARRQAPPPR